MFYFFALLSGFMSFSPTFFFIHTAILHYFFSNRLFSTTVSFARIRDYKIRQIIRIRKYEN